MSFYQKPARRWPVALATGLAALIVGFAIGYPVGQDSAPSLAEQIADARADAADVSTKIAVIETEYPQAVKDGKVLAEVEYAGTRSRAESAARNVEALKDSYGRINPSGYKTAIVEAKALLAAVSAKQPPAEVEPIINRIRSALSQ